MKDPKLIYVIHGGAMHHVSEFAGQPVKHRPEVLCPGCNSPVILKLGEKKTHHAAHKPDSLCLLTRPETVLHLNTKVYLHSQLLSARELYINQYCTGWIAPKIGYYEGGHRECRGNSTWKILWLSGWDRAEMESFIESRKPDVVFYRDGRPVAAIEVRATHAVDEQKRIDLERLGIPWLEIEASEGFYEGQWRWTPDRPLPYIRCAPALPERTCERCLKAPDDHRERVYEAIDRNREERRKQRERRLAHERWLKEEITPRAEKTSKPDKVNLVKILRDESGSEVKYSVIQASDESDTVLMFGDQVIASLPPLATEIWQRLMELYKEHRNSLGVIYTDVTGWVPPTQLDRKVTTIS